MNRIRRLLSFVGLLLPLGFPSLGDRCSCRILRVIMLTVSDSGSRIR